MNEKIVTCLRFSAVAEANDNVLIKLTIVSEFEGQCTTAIYQWKCLREFVFKVNGNS